ncbi:MAG TPA: MFS transporter [Casimicrobiaceae bacterium]|jgi:EmrB/QacA subfamily drug resistance transporter|nr:MFS transporter [Casimicrobiaceae bacterium]
MAEPSPPANAPPLPADALRAAFRRVFPGVMFAMFLAAVDQTILASALPAIVASLGGFADLSWVVVAYLLAATVAAPLYGSIGDRFGRRPTLLAALIVFTVASLGCALAPTLPLLILARAVQGLGGGGLMTLSQALISENVPPRQRAQFQGYFAGVFAASSTLGPLLGALLTEHLSWRAVFFINLPLGVVAAVLALRIPRHAPPARARFRPDVVGTLLFGTGTLALLFALSSAGNRFGWLDWRLYAVLALAAGCLAALVVWEVHTPDPVIPVRLLASPVIWRSNLVVACFAAALFGSVLYLPLYLQLGRGFGIGTSGLLLLPITLSLAASSALTGRSIARTGKLTAYPKLGLAVSTVAFLALAATVTFAPTPVVLGLTLLAGAGLGTTMPPTQIIVQSAGGSASLASAVASVSVSRSIGGALGVAIVGAVLFILVGREDTLLASVLPQIAESRGAFLATLPDAQRLAITTHLGSAFRVIFFVLAAFTLIGAWAAAKVPVQRL